MRPAPPGFAGALIATFFYIVPTVGETLGIVAFVTVSLGGFGSVPGALVAGLLIGVIESLVGVSDRRGLQGHRGLFAVPRLPLVPAAGPDGQDVMRRWLWLSVLLALVIAYPLLFSTPFQQRLGALVLLYAIAASAWNIVGGYAGQVSVGHVVFFGCGAYAAMGAYTHFALSPLVGIPVGIVVSVAIAAVIGVPTLRLSGHYFSMATIAVAELVEADRHQHRLSRRGCRTQRPDRAAQRVRSLLHLGAAVLLSVPGGSGRSTLGITWWMADSRMGFYLRAIRDSERAARSLGAPASRTKLYAFMLSAGLTSVAGALYAMMFGFVDPESGLGILISVKMLIMAALGGAGLLFGPLVGAAILVPLEEISNNLARRQGRRPDLRRLWRHHRVDRALSAGRPSDPDQPAWGEARQGPETSVAAGSHPCSLKPATSPRPSAASRPSMRASVTLEQGDILGLIGPNGAGKSTLLQLPDRRPAVDIRQGAVRRPGHHGI